MNKADPQSPSSASSEIPALPPDATPEQKDQHWLRHVYQGDDMPQLTLRAVLTGGLIGMAMCCAHLYTVLAIGWSFGVAITACVMSYVIWNVLRAVSGRRLSPMSILENNCMQSTASAAGYSTGSTLATCFGALLLLTAVPAGGSGADVKTWQEQPILLVGLFTFLTGSLGVFLAIPMKRQMINHEQLPFPSGVAAATTLRSLYSHGLEALRKAYSLVAALFFAMLWGVLRTDPHTAGKISLGPGRSFQDLFDWFQARLVPVQMPEQIPAAGFYKLHDKSLYKFAFEPSFLLIAAGMIVGLRVSLSMLAGSALLYLVVTPAIIDMDRAGLAAAADPSKYVISIPVSPSGTTYRVTYWALWGGTAVMVCASLTALALQWKTVARSFRIFKDAAPSAEDVALQRVEVPNSWLIAGVIPISIALIALLYFAYDINPLFGLLAVAMAFVLSMVAARSTGETDTTPTGAMGKVMQLLFAGLSPGNVPHNLISAGAAANSASACSDLLTDLKSGYVLGANPRRQFLAQFVGVFFGTAAILPCWYLMVPDRDALDKFPAPATRQWQAVAEILTKGVDQLPSSAILAICIGAGIGIALPIIERRVPARVRPYMPSAMGLGLSWVIPFSNALSFALGALIVWLWGRVHSTSKESFYIPIASGLIAGESLAAGMIAMLATAFGLLHIGAG